MIHQLKRKHSFFVKGTKIIKKLTKMDPRDVAREAEALEMALFMDRTARNPNQTQINNILRAIEAAKREQLRQIRAPIDRENANMRRALDLLRERDARRGKQ